MKLYTDSDAPRIPEGVLTRLRNLDPQLRVTYSRWAINPETSLPIEFSRPDPDVWEKDAMDRLQRRGNSWLLEEPRWWLWALRPDGKAYLIRSYSVKDVVFQSPTGPATAPGTRVFGMREVEELEADWARLLKPGEIAAKLMKIEEERAAALEASKRAAQQDRAAANANLIYDIATGETKTHREPKVSSYEGQGMRRSSGEHGASIYIPDRELGFER